MSRSARIEQELRGLLLVPFLWAFSNSMLIPVLPLIRQEIGISNVQAGLIITALSIPTGLLLPFTGLLSDRLGRHRVMIPGIILYGLGGLLAGLAGKYLQEPYTAIILSRGIQGLGASATTLVAMARISDLTSGPSRISAQGNLEAANSTGKLISPIVGSLASLAAWYAPFFVFPVLSLVTAIYLARLKVSPGSPSSGTLNQYMSRLAHAFRVNGLTVAITLLAGFTAILTWFGSLFLFSLVLDSTFGVTGTARGIATAIPVLVVIAASIFTVRRFPSVQPGLIAVWGFGVILSAAVGTAFSPDLFLVRGGILLLGAGLGITLPALDTIITSSVAASERGVTTALYGTVRSFGSALGPPAFALMAGPGDSALLVVNSLLVIAAFASLLLFLVRPFINPSKAGPRN